MAISLLPTFPFLPLVGLKSAMWPKYHAKGPFPLSTPWIILEVGGASVYGAHSRALSIRVKSLINIISLISHDKPLRCHHFLDAETETWKFKSLAQDYTANRNIILSLPLSVFLIHSGSDQLFVVVILLLWSFSEVSTLAAS